MEILGDDRGFFSDLLQRTKKAGIDVTGCPIVQLLYRTETLSEYKEKREVLKSLSKEFVETFFNGRAVSIAILKESLALEGGFSTDCIELPAPRAAHTYPSGLESVGFLVTPHFKEKYRHKYTGIKEHGKLCRPAFLTFDNEKTVKFYDHTLQEIIFAQGWRFEKVDKKDPFIERLNAWNWFFHSQENWRNLTSMPEKTDRGTIYRLPNFLKDPKESCLITEVTAPTLPHAHTDKTHLYFVLEGSGYFSINDKRVDVEKESTIIIPPHTSHATFPKEKLVLGVVNCSL